MNKTNADFLNIYKSLQTLDDDEQSNRPTLKSKKIHLFDNRFDDIYQLTLMVIFLDHDLYNHLFDQQNELTMV